MKKLKALSLIIIIILVAYVAADQSGMIDYFTSIVNEEDGWKKTGPSTYTKIMTSTYWHYSLLKDPEPKKKFQLLQGAIKKSAIDRMEYVLSSKIEIFDHQSYEDIKDDLKFIASSQGCNTVIIDAKSGLLRSQTKRWVF